MRFNDITEAGKEKSLEIVFEDHDSIEEQRFVRTAFENIKSQAHFNKVLVELSRNVVFKKPK